MTAATTVLVNQLWPKAASNGLLRNIALAVGGTLLVALAAHISVPGLPVPLTLQTLAVLAIGAAFGARLGAATMLLYAVEGAAGLPVFSPTADGYPGIIGPTGGYIIGFIFAAGLVGYLAERGWDRSLPKMLLACLLGGAILYVPGLLWLSTFVGGLEKAIEFGLAPFWIGDLIKAAIASLGFPVIWALIGRDKGL
jgi:biotin transport system substrate-specific component